MGKRSFGKIVRRLREKRLKTDDRFTLRKIAGIVGISPTYLSKVERSDFPPPSEKRIIAMAKALEADPDWLLSLAGKVPSDLQKIILGRPLLLSRFIRKLGKLSDKQIEKVLRKIDDRVFW